MEKNQEAILKEENEQLKKQFRLLSEIMRASHFEWRRAALKLNPKISGEELVRAYWREVGIDTAQFYIKKIDFSQNVAAQVAKLYVESSVAMGEAAEVVLPEFETFGDLLKQPGRACQAKHRDCPWFHWHKKLGLLSEDRPGCDEWLTTVVAEIGRLKGVKLCYSTDESLPEGGPSCLRTFWVEGDSATEKKGTEHKGKENGI